jgi:hypothetical protein
MIIDDNESDADDTELPVTVDVAGTAYRETLTSADGFTRGPNGRIKFNKDTKKRRREENAMDVDLDLDEISPKKTKRKDEPKFGHEFKARVSDGLDMWIKAYRNLPHCAEGCRRCQERRDRALRLHADCPSCKGRTERSSRRDYRQKMRYDTLFLSSSTKPIYEHRRKKQPSMSYLERLHRTIVCSYCQVQHSMTVGMPVQ